MKTPVNVGLIGAGPAVVRVEGRAELIPRRGERAVLVRHTRQGIADLQQNLPRTNHYVAEVCRIDFRNPPVSVRGEPALHGIVVIMLGFPGEPDEIKRAYELGVNSYVVKPPFEAYNYLFAAIHRYWLRCNEQPDWLVHSSSRRRKSDACTDFARASVFL